MSSSSFFDDGAHRRPTRPSYVPPHLRYSKPLSANAAEFSPSTRTPNSPTRFPRPRQPYRGARPKPEPDPLERFSSLEISEPAGINFDAYEDIPVETSGSDIPPPAETFADIALSAALCRNLERCGYQKPTPVQRHAIPISLASRDLMACAQTGSGKTAAFLFPIISGISAGPMPTQPQQRGRTAFPVALIMAPTRELSSQIHDEAKKFAYQTGIKVLVAYGGTSIHHQLRDLEKGVDILVATPGRLVDLVERARVSLQNIKYLALDEADRMLEMGFEPQIRKIVEQMDMPPPGVRQTMLLSATFPQEIQRLASDFLSNYIFLAVGRVGSSTNLITQRVEYVPDLDKRSRLMDLLHSQRMNGTHGKQALTLVFVETKRKADKLEHWLSMNGFHATAIHGDRSQHEREQALKSFKVGQTPIMVATDVAARGLDVPHVAHVINFDLPKDIDDYVHRIGRTGRAGKSGLATAFFSDGNQSLAKALADLMQESKQEVPDWLFQVAGRTPHGGGRNRKFGGNRFGGHDYRKDASARRGNFHSNSYGGNLGGGDSRNHQSLAYGGNLGGNDTSYHSAAYGSDLGVNDTSYHPSAYGGNLGGNDRSYHSYGGYLGGNDRGNYHSPSYEANGGGNNNGGGGGSYYPNGYDLGHGPVVPSGWD